MCACTAFIHKCYHITFILNVFNSSVSNVSLLDALVEAGLANSLWLQQMCPTHRGGSLHRTSGCFYEYCDLSRGYNLFQGCTWCNYITVGSLWCGALCFCLSSFFFIPCRSAVALVILYHLALHWICTFFARHSHSSSNCTLYLSALYEILYNVGLINSFNLYMLARQFLVCTISLALKHYLWYSQHGLHNYYKYKPALNDCSSDKLTQIVMYSCLA